MRIGTPCWLAATLAAFAVSGCVGSAADHEVLGDQAYGEGRFDDALVEYRVALNQVDPNVRLRVKAGAAALRAGDLFAAVEEYLALARDGDEVAASEAADGLERVARAAGEVASQASLAAALDALEQIAPARARGEFALQLAREMAAEGPPEEVLSILLHAAAAAPDARLQDSLMFSYAETLRRQQRCGEAMPVFESLIRRQGDRQLVQRARTQLRQCASVVGWRSPRDKPLDGGRLRSLPGASARLALHDVARVDFDTAWSTESGFASGPGDWLAAEARVAGHVPGQLTTSPMVVSAMAGTGVP